MKIQSINAMQILNSRGFPTIETKLVLDNGVAATASVPSGASKGKNEALELIDNNPEYYGGRSVLNAVKNVNTTIKENIINHNVLEQTKIDQLLNQIDGTHNKSRLGANAILSVSLAACKAAAKSLNTHLYKYLSALINEKNNFCYHPPMPMINILNGGVHADNNLAIQEFMIVPANATDFRTAISNSADVFYSLKDVLRERKYSINVGDEGGFAPQINTSNEALELLKHAIKDSDISIALDSAASEFYIQGKYNIDGQSLDSRELIAFYHDISSKYNITSIEDPCAENDIYGWIKITKELGKKMILVGDDIFVTNQKIFQEGIKNKIANAILIKMNQIGSITETINAIRLAKKNNYSVIISHRSGETEDTSIAHLAVACGEGTMIKAGSLARSERVAKYNEILRIEENFI